jgi:hypothetical protein
MLVGAPKPSTLHGPLQVKGRGQPITVAQLAWLYRDWARALSLSPPVSPGSRLIGASLWVFHYSCV